jgi:hypothetical protein
VDHKSEWRQSFISTDGDGVGVVVCDTHFPTNITHRIWDHLGMRVKMAAALDTRTKVVCVVVFTKVYIVTYAPPIVAIEA